MAAGRSPEEDEEEEEELHEHSFIAKGNLSDF